MNFDEAYREAYKHTQENTAFAYIYQDGLLWRWSTSYFGFPIGVLYLALYPNGNALALAPV